MLRHHISRRVPIITLQCAPSFRPTSLSLPRFLSTTPATSFSSKDVQDKDSLNPQSSEYSKSGTDDAVSAESDAAFNPKKTRPEQEKRSAEKSGGGDPLDISPGNPEISKPRGDQEGGAQGSSKTRRSGGGSANKAGGNKSG